MNGGSMRTGRIETDAEEGDFEGRTRRVWRHRLSLKDPHSSTVFIRTTAVFVCSSHFLMPASCATGPGLALAGLTDPVLSRLIELLAGDSPTTTKSTLGPTLSPTRPPMDSASLRLGARERRQRAGEHESLAPTAARAARLARHLDARLRQRVDHPPPCGGDRRRRRTRRPHALAEPRRLRQPPAGPAQRVERAELVGEVAGHRDPDARNAQRVQEAVELQRARRRDLAHELLRGLLGGPLELPGDRPRSARTRRADSSPVHHPPARRRLLADALHVEGHRREVFMNASTAPDSRTSSAR